MKELLIAFMELMEDDVFCLDNAEMDDAIHFIELGWVKDGQPTQEGIDLFQDWSEYMGGE